MIFSNPMVSDEEKWIFNCFLFPLIEMFLFYAVTTYLLLARIPITPFNLVICYLMGAAYLFFSDRGSFVKSLITSTIVLMVPMLLCAFVWDYSWDGNAYHKLSVGLLRNGWNPVYQTVYDAVSEAGVFAEGTAGGAFYDGYPKASYMIGAVMYAFAGRIEAGKAYNLLAMISAFGVVYFVCKDALSLRGTQAGAVAFVLCCNTVTASQAFTYYNDGLLQELVFIVCAELFYLYRKDEGRLSIAHLVIAMSIIIGVNLKYSAMLLFFLPCLVYLASVLLAKRERVPFTVAFYSVVVCAALVAFGLTSYVHNAVFHHNPLYALVGEGKQDVLSPSVPYMYRGIPNISRLVCSIFSPYSNSMEMERIALKVPFSLSLSEVKGGSIWCDTRMGGWGIFYSGLFCASFVVFVFRLMRNGFDLVNGIYLTFMAAAFVPALFINCLNTARYWPFPYFFPAWLLYVLLAGGGRNARRLSLVAVLLSFLNLVPMGYGYLRCGLNTREAKRQIEAAPVEKGADLHFDFPGLIYNLNDSGVSCRQKHIGEDVSYGNVMKYFGMRVCY